MPISYEIKPTKIFTPSVWSSSTHRPTPVFIKFPTQRWRDVAGKSCGQGE